jgi:hypothetical protein
MKWLNREIILETLSMDYAVLIFSLLSLFCSVITILIYLRIKSLRTIIYKIFFLIAINETISRIFHILEFLNSISFDNAILLKICSSFIYLTDTAILCFLALSCHTMHELIIRQNKKINIHFPLYVKIALGISISLTIFFVICLFQNKSNNMQDINLYGAIISLNFPRDKREKEIYEKKDFNFDIAVISVTSTFYGIIVIYTIGIVIMIRSFIKKREYLGYMEEDRYSENKFRQKTFKLKSFKNKLAQYPLIGVYFFFPLVILSIIELHNKSQWLDNNEEKKIEETNKEEDQGNLEYLRIRFIFYNINCFLNSIRGWLYFKIFISNEKIKIFLFKKYLTSSVFYTIDKIDNNREISISRNNSSSQHFESSDGSILIEDSFGSSRSGTLNSETGDKYDEKNELFEMQKNRSFNEENNNNLDDDDDEENVINPNLSHDSHSENLKIKNNK